MEKNEEAILDAHLSEWHNISNRLTAQFLPIIEAQQKFQKYVQSAVDARNKFEKMIEPILVEQARFQSVADSISHSISRIDFSRFSRLAKQAADFQNSIQNSLAPAFAQLQKSFLELPPRTREALLLLGAQGWFLDLEMSLPSLWQLKKALSEGNIGDAENALVEYFEGRLVAIEKSIIERFPRRGPLIKSAFNAHRRQEYELSIPVFLAQSDGICKEVVNQHLFLKQNQKPCTAIYVEQIATNTYRAALLSPLAQTLPISASVHERPKGFDMLNRHMVLHGESLDYGTKINSLKAISLINYVSQVLRLSRAEDN